MIFKNFIFLKIFLENVCKLKNSSYLCNVRNKNNRVMKKYLVITNNEKYYLIEAISSMSAAKKLTSYLLKKNNVTLDEVFELIKNVENIIDLTKFNLED